MVGATPLLNLPSKIINKSRRGIVKNNINGLSFKVNSSKDCAKKILAIGSNRKNIIVR